MKLNALRREFSAPKPPKRPCTTCMHRDFKVTTAMCVLTDREGIQWYACKQCAEITQNVSYCIPYRIFFDMIFDG